MHAHVPCLRQPGVLLPTLLHVPRGVQVLVPKPPIPEEKTEEEGPEVKKEGLWHHKIKFGAGLPAFGFRRVETGRIEQLI